MLLTKRNQNNSIYISYGNMENIKRIPIA